MSNDIKHYRLVFTGNLLPGHNEKKVVSGLQDLLNLSREQAERLVCGKHNQINKELTMERAEKLRLLILKQGAECVLLPIEDSFITTQQLPKFVSDGDDIDEKSDSVNEKRIAGKDLKDKLVEESPVSSSNSNHMPVMSEKNANLKLVIIIIILMTIEAAVIWNVKPDLQSAAVEQASNDSSAAKNTQMAELSHPVRQLTPTESDTDRKLKRLSVRASAWFSEQGGDINPADVNWIWIQGDRGISVREMNDSWGNTIRYYGANDGFELRSSGIDGKFYTKDDIFRKTIL